MTSLIACAIQLNIFLTRCVQKNSKPVEVRTTGSVMPLTSIVLFSGSTAVSILSTLWYVRDKNSATNQSRFQNVKSVVLSIPDSLLTGMIRDCLLWPLSVAVASLHRQLITSAPKSASPATIVPLSQPYWNIVFVTSWTRPHRVDLSFSTRSSSTLSISSNSISNQLLKWPITQWMSRWENDRSDFPKNYLLVSCRNSLLLGFTKPELCNSK